MRKSRAFVLSRSAGGCCGGLRFEYAEVEMIVTHPCGELAVDCVPRLDFKFRSPEHMNSIKTNRADLKKHVWLRKLPLGTLSNSDYCSSLIFE